MENHSLPLGVHLNELGEHADELDHPANLQQLTPVLQSILLLLVNFEANLVIQPLLTTSVTTNCVLMDVSL